MDDLNSNIDDLFLRTVNGDQKAFGEFMLLTKDRLIRLSYKILRDYQLSEDVVSDVFYSIAKNKIKPQHSKNLNGYLNCAVYSRSLNVLKKRKREIGLTENSRITNSEPQLLERIRIERILSKLKIKEREVLIYHYHGYTLAETAEFLKLTISKVRTLLDKAKEIFKIEYEKGER